MTRVEIDVVDAARHQLAQLAVAIFVQVVPIDRPMNRAAQRRLSQRWPRVDEAYAFAFGRMSYQTTNQVAVNADLRSRNRKFPCCFPVQLIGIGGGVANVAIYRQRGGDVDDRDRYIGKATPEPGQ